MELTVRYERDGGDWLEITTRRMLASEVHPCGSCGTPMPGARPDKKFCSDRCRTREHRRKKTS